jgi:integrase
MPLTDIQIKNAKPKVKPDGSTTDKPYRMFDERGLYLEVAPSGGKWWRLKFRFGGKEKRISLGTYPDVSLKKARERRDHYRSLVADGVDPLDTRKAEKLANSGQDTFEFVAREWHSKNQRNWSKEHTARILTRLTKNIFPWLGARNIKDITAPDLLNVLRRMESRGAIDTAHRALQESSQIFRYAIVTGKCERDPAADLKGAIVPVRRKHHASITEPKKIGELLRAINDYSGSFVTLCALKLAPLLFVRPGELRQAEWSEFDFTNSMWRIPASKMKMKIVHFVPLSEQAIKILHELFPLTGDDKYLFPSVRTKTRPMSDNTLNGALRRLGFTKDEMTAHGFRSMASTLLNEQGWNKDAIERQLAHSERDGVRAAYNYAEYLPERVEMMQAWADYLDKLARKRLIQST